MLEELEKFSVTFDKTKLKDVTIPEDTIKWYNFIMGDVFNIIYYLLNINFKLWILISYYDRWIFKLQCIYILKDVGNNELFIYLGRGLDIDTYKQVLSAEEFDLDEKPSGKVN